MQPSVSSVISSTLGLMPAASQMTPRERIAANFFDAALV
jgi:hypothetical protein